MCNNWSNHRNGNLPERNPHEGEIPWNFPRIKAIHHNGQISYLKCLTNTLRIMSEVVMYKVRPYYQGIIVWALMVKPKVHVIILW
jgi:hypothetical protein